MGLINRKIISNIKKRTFQSFFNNVIDILYETRGLSGRHQLYIDKSSDQTLIRLLTSNRSNTLYSLSYTLIPRGSRVTGNTKLIFNIPHSKKSH